MKKEHDQIASNKRKENYSKVWFLKALELLKKKRIIFKDVIDVGSGKGEFLEILKDNFNISRAAGIDYTEPDLKLLESKGIEAIKINLDNFRTEDYEKLKSKFDLVICLETIEHVFNADRLFKLFHYLLKEKGFILISTPNMGALSFRLFCLLRGYPFGENHHVRFFSKNKLQQYAFFNGFDFFAENNYFTFQSDIIKRGFGIRNKFLVYFMILLFFAPLFMLSRLKLLNSLVNDGFAVLFRKSQLAPLGLEIHNFKMNFEKLSDKEKKLWINRIKEYYKRDKLGEHIYFKPHIEKIIKEGE